ncbi:MAG: dihydroneopterin triphosphate 2'-epimerase [Gammaproteobacteria bacterium]|nr:dihydroneopterin triphosphate 2'-epimerase [Gammaproteobacteria bacterium]
MSVKNATINISNLRLRTYIGFNPEEKVKKQDLVINIEISYSLNPEILEDRVEYALDYKAISKNIIEFVEDGHFLLLEKLVADVLDICTTYPGVTSAKVTIDKPHALRFADSVSLSLEYTADKTNSLALLEKAS